jgi:hypothetical protein
MSKRRTSAPLRSQTSDENFKRRVFLPGFQQNWKVRVGVFPSVKKSLYACLARAESPAWAAVDQAGPARSAAQVAPLWSMIFRTSVAAAALSRIVKYAKPRKYNTSV